jgi:hypothetical protein
MLTVTPYSHKDMFAYKDIIISGGEPFLYPKKFILAAARIYTSCDFDSKIYVYTAGDDKFNDWLREEDHLDMFMSYIDGITYTLHKQSDFKEFTRFDQITQKRRPIGFSRRLYLMPGVDISKEILYADWEIKNITPQKSCPLPDNEECYLWEESKWKK